MVTLPAQVLSHTQETQYILADVETCNTDIRGPSDVKMYDSMSILQMVDMGCVQCLIGRVKVIDRSGELDGAIYAEEHEHD